MKARILSCLLILTLALGLTGTTLAAKTAFSDVPAYAAYA